MLTALTPDGTRTEPRPGATGACPTCRRPVRAKCGQVVTWHWAHQTRDDCDLWAEPDTDWHSQWQALAPLDRREVVIGRHRADIVTPDGTVLELQHSNLPVEQITARERHYDRMVWLFDARQAVAQERLLIRPRRPDGYATFRWKHPRKSLAWCTRPVLLDLGTGQLLALGTIHPDPPCGGWGRLRPVTDVHAFINGNGGAR